VPRKPKGAVRAAGFIQTVVEVEGRTETRIVEVPAFEPAPWTEDMPLGVVGARVPRADAAEKVTGRARYTSDIARPGMLHAVFLRAPIPRGTIRTIDLAPAKAVPGVYDVLGPGDAPKKTRLFSRDILYAEQPVAAVCADTRAAAIRAVHAIRIEYDATPFALTFEEAVAPGAPSVRPAGNVMKNAPHVEARGDIEAGLRAADIVVRREYRTPVALHSALETHGAVAEWEGDRITVWESTQGIFRVREMVAQALDVPLSKVRVIQDYMGGGFGAKNGAGAHTYAAALFARRLGRAVRCVNDRKAEQSDSGNRPATTQRVTLGAKKDGTLTAIHLSADIPLGISGWEGGPGQFYHEMYACPNVRTEETFAFVNTSGMQAFRGPGYTEGAFGLESAMNVLAKELSIDPVALRKKGSPVHGQQASRVLFGRRRTVRLADACAPGLASRVRRLRTAGSRLSAAPRPRRGRPGLAHRRRPPGVCARPSQRGRVDRRPLRHPGSRHWRPHRPRSDRRRGARCEARARARHHRGHAEPPIHGQLVGLDDHGERRPRGADGGRGRQAAAVRGCRDDARHDPRRTRGARLTRRRARYRSRNDLR
jgi:hypothetical protein